MMNGNVLDYLSKERQVEVMKEVAKSVLSQAPGKTLGAMVAWLTKHPQWKALAALPASTLVSTAPSGARSTASQPRKRRHIDAAPHRDAVLALVRSNPGKRSEELQKLSDLPRPIWKKALGWLREQGKVVTKGNKRASIYFAAKSARVAKPKAAKRPAKKSTKKGTK